MQELRDIYANSNVEVFLINEDPASNQIAHLREAGIVVPAAFDRNGQLRRSLGVDGGTSTLIADANGLLSDPSLSHEYALELLGVAENWPLSQIDHREMDRLLAKKYFIRLVELQRRGLIIEEATTAALSNIEFQAFCRQSHPLETSRARRALLAQWLFGQRIGSLEEEIRRTVRVHGVEFRIDRPEIVSAIITEGLSISPENAVSFAETHFARAIIMRSIAEGTIIPTAQMKTLVQTACEETMQDFQKQFGPFPKSLN